MRRLVVMSLSLALLVLALLALDDITTGTEPGHALEWTTVAAAGLWFGGLLLRRLRPTR